MSDILPTDTLGPGDCCPKCGGEVESAGIEERYYLAWQCRAAACGYRWKTPLFEGDEDEDEG